MRSVSILLVVSVALMWPVLITLGCTTKTDISNKYPNAVFFELPGAPSDYCFVSDDSLYYVQHLEDPSLVFTHDSEVTEQITIGDESEVDEIVSTLVKYHGGIFRYNVARRVNDFSVVRYLFVKTVDDEIWYYKFKGSKVIERSQIVKLESDKKVNVNIDLTSE